MKKRKNMPPVPTDLRTTVLELLAKSDQTLTKNQIARLLQVYGDDRITLKHLLAELEAEGKLTRGSKRKLSVTDRPWTVGRTLLVEITHVGDNAELTAIPLEWPHSFPAPQIILSPPRHKQSIYHTLGIGSHALIRLVMQKKDTWQAELIKKLEKTDKVHLGIFTHNKHGGGRLSPCHRKDPFPGVKLSLLESKDFREGDIVAYSVTRTHSVKIHEKIGRIDDPKTFSQMAIYAHNLPHTFSQEAINLSEQGKVPELGKRKDLRSIPLVTIDGEDARDFDDAVWAEADSDPQNLGGWRILVAIADVAYYVRPGDALDHEARERGNSVYFPDRVVPMLPEGLSNELCSLKPNVDRACLAIEMIISAEGKIKSHLISRGLMRSQARLTYTQVQHAIEGNPDETTRPLLENVLKSLYGAYKALEKARSRRGTLEIMQTERQVIFNENGHIDHIIPRQRFDSHRLIEEFMIAANVAAARTLTDKGWPCLYRVHDSPDALRVSNLRQTLKRLKVPFTKATNPQPSQFNELLKNIRQNPLEQMISDLVLRCQAQAQYSPINIGHFGLSLSQYAHFTSPIRRYADLIVHRSLISALHLGDDGLPEKTVSLTSVAEHISTTERRAAVAERDALERFVTAYHVPHVGNVLMTTIVGVTKVGLFVAVKDTGAQGFIPRRSLQGDVFDYEETNHRFLGRRTKTVYQLGSPLEVRLHSADIATNSLIFEIETSFSKREKSFPKKQKNNLKKFKKIKKKPQ